MYRADALVFSDVWLSRVLSRPVYRAAAASPAVHNGTAQQAGGASLAACMLKSPVFIYAKVPADDAAAVRYLESNGFNVIETNLLLEKPVRPSSPGTAGCTVRLSAPDDAPQVVELARSNFDYSRFHMDDRFAKQEAHRLKAAWVGSYYSGSRGNAMVVALAGERIVGFLLLIFAGSDALVIDLIAVARDFRRKGVAGAMIAFAESSVHSFTTIRAGTQAVNTPSVRLYENLGFRLKAAQYTLHYHNYLTGI